jgi:phosphate:Na+ symporter
MDLTAILTSLLTLLAGIGVFLIACQMMSSNLEAASSEKLKQLFSKASNSKLMGVGIGALGTAAIQSSGATTVMTIGFVNAGIISLAQAATIIYGANIGTTVTAQIVALGMFGGNSLSTSVIFSAFAGLGAFLSIFAKRSGPKTVGGILAGFGLLFVGLELMSGSMEQFAALDGVKTFLAGIGNPILLVLLGAVFTAIIQSSSVMTSIALDMAVQLDFSGRSLFERAERELNFINRELVGLVVRLNGRSGLGEKDRTYLSGTYRSIRDLERIGDYAENIVEYATVLADTSQQFSDDAKYEISQLKKLLHQLYAHAMDAYQNESLESLREANFIEEEIDDYTKEMEDGHIARMEKGICTPSVGAQYLELSSNAERIADHMINIAKSIKSLKATKS